MPDGKDAKTQSGKFSEEATQRITELTSKLTAKESELQTFKLSERVTSLLAPLDEVLKDTRPAAKIAILRLAEIAIRADETSPWKFAEGDKTVDKTTVEIIKDFVEAIKQPLKMTEGEIAGDGALTEEDKAKALWDAFDKEQGITKLTTEGGK